MSDPLRDIAIEVEKAPKTSQAKFWGKELDLARKREKKWRKEAEKAVKLYEGQSKTENSFNILYSNTETLLPACYNQLPKPIVERRYKDADPLAKASSTALERAISYMMDAPDAEYEPFSSLMEQAVLGALVPGRGLTRFRYDPQFEDTADAVGDEAEAGGEEAGEEEEDVTEGGEAVFPDTSSGKKVVYEVVCGEDIDWDGFLMGYARRWKDVPWIAFFHAMSKEDLEENFGDKIADSIDLTTKGKKDAEDWKKKEEDDEDNQGSVQVADVYEIWNKAKKEVVFYCEAYAEKVLKVVPDPLGLSGFYPCPEPLTFLLKRSNQTPVPLYSLYEEQAKELNSLSRRINKVLNAMKVRGFYDNSIQGIQELLTKDDGTLLPAKNVAGLQDGKNLQNSIWMMPLNELQVVLQQLMMGREQCKQTIYEITGIADIMRGQGQASETATAQNIKNQWGTLRLKRLQRYVQTYVRACLRIMGELAGENFAVETFAGMTNLDYATAEQVAQAQQTLQAVQQAQMQQPPMQAPMQPGMQPPSAPQPSPQLMQQAQQAQAVLAKPQWEQVLGMLRDDLQRNYKIDIETNSTIDATSQEDKQNITEAMTAIANTMQTFEPAMEKGIFPMPAFKELMLSVARRFEFGRQVEESLQQIPDQPPAPPPNPEAEKKAKEVEQKAQQLAQQEQQLNEQAMNLKMQEKQLQMDVAMAKKELDMEKQQALMDIKMQSMKEGMALTQQEVGLTIKSAQDGAKREAEGAKLESKVAIANQPKAVMKQREQMDAMHAKNMQAVVQAVVEGNKSLLQAIGELTQVTRAPKQLVVQKGPDGKVAGLTSTPVLQ